ncbi:hypothetical protein RJT34_12344 [Clitoria ternatea]|uniref:Uncharacterized protein n=1 Tax=Clitoria ternatea TaxID=43366 RepID=A0AAN9JQ52_CLITE
MFGIVLCGFVVCFGSPFPLACPIFFSLVSLVSILVCGFLGRGLGLWVLGCGWWVWGGDIQRVAVRPWGGGFVGVNSFLFLPFQEHHIRTGCGFVSVIVYSDQDKPALITYPDLAQNYMSCFQGLFYYPEVASLLLHNFCIYHISPPGHELGTTAISLDDPTPSAEDLADQIIEILNHFGLGAVMCMGVTAGAYILTLFAMKYRERVLGLILVSPLCKAPSWTEWFYNKMMSNLLYFYRMCGLLKECLLQRYFSKEVRGNVEVPESEIVQACRKLLDERKGSNVLRFLLAINQRPDITEGLK